MKMNKTRRQTPFQEHHLLVSQTVIVKWVTAPVKGTGRVQSTWVLVPLKTTGTVGSAWIVPRNPGLVTQKIWLLHTRFQCNFYIYGTYLIVWFKKRDVASTDIVRLDEIVQKILSYAIFFCKLWYNWDKNLNDSKKLMCCYMYCISVHHCWSPCSGIESKVMSVSVNDLFIIMS